ncbi:Outer membrane protein assembly factor BamA [Usitatibacter rugosus]|uniref:Outer membrane protein assembly factor BamA n=1 Tax=Usitatibacter rugosus TaxID=2732067 RepID=A0A6M4GSX7_9PROT|nr:Outer membrane protein assembly factor BamA [Usitatibacter rugosus]
MLKVLRENRIPVHLVVATSMGSIVGGAYAAGHTPEAMEAMVRDADWDLMFSARPPREDLSFRRKEDDLRLIGRTEFGIKSDGITLPRGAFGSQNLEEFLRIVARPASEIRQLDALPIPMRAVATDLETGQLVVLRDVTLVEAMRASMSIPGAFAPTTIDGRLLGDGGLVRNLPVEVARSMGADVIIAVNVGTPLLPREALSSALGVAQQMINILTEQNVGISLGALKPTDVLISPELRDVTFLDFDKGPDLIARGEAAARAALPKLAALALEPREYAFYEERRTRRRDFPEEVVEAIVVRGTQRTNPVALANEVRQRADIAEGAHVTDEQLVKASRVLYGTGEFERVDVHTEYNEGKRFVVLDVDEKPWGPNYLRVGARAVSDAKTDARFSLTLQHTRTWVNPWGAEWRNELEIGDVRRLTTSFYQPLGPGSAWFLEPIAEAIQSDYDIFRAGNHRTDRLTSGTTSVAVVAGRRLGNVGVARLGIGREWYRVEPLISSREASPVKDTGNVVKLGVTFDTLDDANFPRHGYFAAATTSTVAYGSDSSHPVQTYTAQLLYPVTIGRFTVLGIVGGGRSQDDRGGFGLGGFLNLSGTPVGAVSGSQNALAAAVMYYRMGELPRGLGGNWYLGTSLEAGNAWARRSDVTFSDVRKAVSVFLGLDTLLGPLYIGYGHTFSGGSAAYLFLGRPTDRN